MIFVAVILLFLIWRNVRRSNPARVIGPGGQLVSLLAGLGLLAVAAFMVISLTGHAP